MKFKLLMVLIVVFLPLISSWALLLKSSTWTYWLESAPGDSMELPSVVETGSSVCPTSCILKDPRAVAVVMGPLGPWCWAPTAVCKKRLPEVWALWAHPWVLWVPLGGPRKGVWGRCRPRLSWHRRQSHFRRRGRRCWHFYSMNRSRSSEVRFGAEKMRKKSISYIKLWTAIPAPIGELFKVKPTSIFTSREAAGHGLV